MQYYKSYHTYYYVNGPVIYSYIDPTHVFPYLLICM